MATVEQLNPWRPITDSVDLKHLGKFLEELGECTAATSRVLIQGLNEVEPVTRKPNREWFEEEIADVLANIDLVCDRFDLNRDFISRRVSDKKFRLRTWHEMA
jgi:hypothetical protein